MSDSSTSPFIEILCEGTSDVPTAEEIMRRRFKLNETHFRIHPHRGKGKLPSAPDYLKKLDPRQQQHNNLLDQLPIKLKNMGHQGVGVIVLVDADSEDCQTLKQSILKMYKALPSKPNIFLVRIAIEETESWFLADPDAVKRAFPHAVKQKLKMKKLDEVCGAWEKLASALDRDSNRCTGGDKTAWAKAIAPFLDLDNPKSPSLRAFVTGVEKLLRHAPKVSATGASSHRSP